MSGLGPAVSERGPEPMRPQHNAPASGPSRAFYSTVRHRRSSLGRVTLQVRSHHDWTVDGRLRPCGCDGPPVQVRYEETQSWYVPVKLPYDPLTLPEMAGIMALVLASMGTTVLVLTWLVWSWLV